MNKNIKIIILAILIIVFIGVISILYIFNIIPHKYYSNKDFNINTYVSEFDKDNDGIDDQTDILKNVKRYIETKPKYKSKYYGTGYPDDEYGVCTDVVAFGLKDAGYDLMELVNEDIINNQEKYNIETIDKNIDFRRVKNLNIYFKNNNITLTTDLSRIDEWQGGDIVVFNEHIGIVSDKRNKKGIPFLIHHANPMQVNYEEDVMELYERDIIAHYRISNIYPAIAVGHKLDTNGINEDFDYLDYIGKSTSTENISLSIKEGTLTNSGATLVIEDKNEYPYCYDTSYSIEKKKGENWVLIGNKVDTEESSVCSKSGIYEIRADWSKICGKLKKGEYRITKEYNNRGTMIHLYANFEIK